jgi:Sigma-70 region 3
VRPVIASIIDDLVTRHGTTRRVDLNDIAEVIGTRAVSYDEVDHIITELGRRGCQVGGPPSARELLLLREVLKATRSLQTELGRRPGVEEIAAKMDQPTFVVRRALENGGTMNDAG